MRDHHAITKQLFSNIEPVLAATDYIRVTHSLAAWDARRIAAALSDNRDERRKCYGLAEVLEHPRYLVDESVRTLVEGVVSK